MALATVIRSLLCIQIDNSSGLAENTAGNSNGIREDGWYSKGLTLADTLVWHKGPCRLAQRACRLAIQTAGANGGSLRSLAELAAGISNGLTVADTSVRPTGHVVGTPGHAGGQFKRPEQAAGNSKSLTELAAGTSNDLTVADISVRPTGL